MSTKAFLKGVESWKKETITKRVNFCTQVSNYLNSFLSNLVKHSLVYLLCLFFVVQEAARCLELNGELIDAQLFYLHFL